MATANLDIRLRIKDDGSAVITQVRDKVGDVGKTGQAAGRKMADAFDLATKALAALGVTLGAAALVGFGRRMLANADAVAKAADKVGLATEALQELRYAAERAGVGQATLDMAMQRFSRRVGEAAQGGGELAGTLEQYGIAVTDAHGRTRSLDDVLDDLADAIAGAGSEQERLRIAFKAFDSEGAALVGTLKNGRQGLAELRQEARDLGLVLDDSLIREAEAANDELGRLGGTLRTGLTRAFLDLAPVLQETAEDLRDFLQENDWESWARGAVDAMQWVGRGLRDLASIPGTQALFSEAIDEGILSRWEWVLGTQEELLDKIRERVGTTGLEQLRAGTYVGERLAREQAALEAALRNLEAYGKALDPRSMQALDPEWVRGRLAEIERLQTYTVPPGQEFVGPAAPGSVQAPPPAVLDTATWGENYTDFWQEQGARDAKAYWEAKARAMEQLARSDPGPYVVPGADASYPAADYNPYTQPGADADMPARAIDDEQHARWAENEWQKALVQQQVQDELTRQEKEAEDERLALARQAAAERERLLRSSLGVVQSVTGDYAAFFRQMYEDSGGAARKYWEAYKAFAIAETIVATATGSMEAYKAMAGIPVVGPGLGAAAATAVATLGATKVALIAQQEPAKSFDQGGIFMTPFAGRITAAEPGVGPEVIAPLDKLPALLAQAQAKAGAGGGSSTPIYHVTVNVPLRNDVSPQTVALIEGRLMQALPAAIRQIDRFDPRNRRR